MGSIAGGPSGAAGGSELWEAVQELGGAVGEVAARHAYGPGTFRGSARAEPTACCYS